jgi:hypothetical protein
MRQLAKSAMSLSWALSLLGAKQAYGAATGKINHRDLLGPVTQAALDQLDDSMKRIHRSADTVESRMVDMAFSFLNPVQWFRPQNWRFWNASAAGASGTPRRTFSGEEGGTPDPDGVGASVSEVFGDDTGSAEGDGAS